MRPGRMFTSVVLPGILLLGFVGPLWADVPLRDEDKLNAFDFTGKYFLGFFWELVVVALIGAFFLRRALRKPNDEPTEDVLELHPYEVAYLKGGPKLAVNAALANLVHRGLLVVNSSDRTVVPNADLLGDGHILEQAILASKESRSLHELHGQMANLTAGIRRRLEELGLLLDKSQARKARLLPMCLLLAVVLFGLIKIEVGIARNRPVLFLIGSCGITTLIALGFLWKPHRSRRGDRALKLLQDHNGVLKHAAMKHPSQLQGQELSLAIALFGLGMLTIGPLADLRAALRPPHSQSSYGSSCGSGCSTGGCGGGGGGCGGGGCGGGCGGCGG